MTARSSFSAALLAPAGQSERGGPVAFLRLPRGGLKHGKLVCAGIDEAEVGGIARRQGGQLVDRDVVLAGGGAQREQALLDALKLLGIVVGDAQGRLEMRARVLDGGERDVERLEGRLDQAGDLGAATLEATRRRRQRGHRRLVARHRLVRITQVAGDLLGLHHGGTPLGQRRLLRGLRGQLRKLRHRVTQPFGLALHALHLGALRCQRALAAAQLVPEELDRLRLGIKAPEGVEQRPMGGGVDQGALVMLPMDLDQRGAQKPQGLDADGLVIDEGARAAVRELHAAQDQLIVGLDVVCRRQSAHRVGARQVEGGGHLPFLGTVAHQRNVAAGAERQRKGIEQDGFAGAGLAGQHGQAGRDIEIEPIDQNDVADREAGEHDRYQ